MAATMDSKELDNYTMSVGISFVNAYYKQLGEDPAGLASFFAADSSFTWQTEDIREGQENPQTTIGREAIAARLKQLNLDNAKVHIHSVACQPSVNHAVVVQVVGDIQPHAQVEEQHLFVQLFYLVKVQQKFRYYCYNDCFRYIRDSTRQAETEEYVKPAASPASPARHENVLGSSDPIVSTQHTTRDPGVIGPVSSAAAPAAPVAAPAAAAKEEHPASPMNLPTFHHTVGESRGQYGAVGTAPTTYSAPEQTSQSWAEADEADEAPAKPEPTPAPAAARSPKQQKRETPAAETQAAPEKKGPWGEIAKPAAVPIPRGNQQQSSPQSAAAAPAAAVHEEEEEYTGKPASFADALRRKQGKAAASSAAPVTVQAPATTQKQTAAPLVAGSRADLAAQRKAFEEREAAARRPREQTERRAPKEQTPRFGVFVGKMPSEASETDVNTVFSQFGPVTNVRLPPGKRVAFVDFANEAARNAAIKAGTASVLGQNVVITEPKPLGEGDRKPEGKQDRKPEGKQGNKPAGKGGKPAAK